MYDRTASLRDASGVFAIVPTPFNADLSIDLSSLDRLVDFYEQAGVAGLTILGQMGEASKLDAAEALTVCQRVVGRTGLPVIVGVTAAGYAGIRSLARAAMDYGAAGVLIAPPANLRTDDQIVDYYGEAASAIGDDVPFAIQDYPLTFSVIMTPNVIRRIVSENGNCVMLKHEDWPGLDKISRLRQMESTDGASRIAILCGNGGLFLEFEMGRGADGAMTGYCFPEMLVDVVQQSATGNWDTARELFYRHLPLVRYEQQPRIGLAVRKYVLMRRRVLTSDRQRLPKAVLTRETVAEVSYLLDRLGPIEYPT